MVVTKNHRREIAVISAAVVLFSVVVSTSGNQPAQYEPYNGPLTSVAAEVTQAPTPAPTLDIAVTTVHRPYPEPVDLRSTAPSGSSPPRPQKRSAPRPRPTPVIPPLSGSHLWGHATWYCLPGVSPCMHNHPGGLYAAAGPYLRAALGVNWRGRTVVVSYRGRQVAVVLADWCACGASHTIDLYGDAMMILEPRFRSLGVIPVKISW